MIAALFVLLAVTPAPLGASAPTDSTASVGADPFGDVNDFSVLGIDELLQGEVRVASRSARTLRDAPGIVSVITRDEIQRSGARDLTDVLRFVSGLAIGSDVQGVVGVGVRGLWGHEGKVLLLIDGIEMNELAYSSLQLGMHYPVRTIERIEIIRGPGSVLYGGFAELAVINIITTGPRDLHGLRVGGSIGRFDNDFGHSVGSAVAAGTFGADEASGWSVALSGGHANRTDARIADVYGASFNAPSRQTLRPLQLNLATQWNDFSLRYLYDDYATRQQDGFDAVLDRTVPLRFTTHALAADYDFQLGDSIVLRPSARFGWQEPWHSEASEIDPDYPDLAFDGVIRTFKGTLLADVKPVDSLGVLAGAEYVNSIRTASDAGALRFQSLAGLGEVNFDIKPVTLFAGGRLEHHLTFGDAFVPRAGATALLGDVHGKVLFSKAYRTPSAENQANAMSPLTPERTTVYEVELGWQPARGSFLVANVFQQQIRSPIIYVYIPDEGEGYRNQDQLGTRGIELEYRLRGAFGFATLGYSYFRPFGKLEADFAVPGHDDAVLGFANHKANLLTSFQVTENFSLNPSVVWYSSRWAITGVDILDEAVYEKVPASALANVTLRYENVIVRDLALGLGVMNVFDAEQPHVQPYAGFHAPLPERGREFVLTADYELPF